MHGSYLKERKATQMAPLVKKIKEGGHFGQGEETKLDFKVDISDFEGQLDLDPFLD